MSLNIYNNEQKDASNEIILSISNACAIYTAFIILDHVMWRRYLVQHLRLQHLNFHAHLSDAKQSHAQKNNKIIMSRHVYMYIHVYNTHYYTIKRKIGRAPDS